MNAKKTEKRKTNHNEIRFTKKDSSSQIMTIFNIPSPKEKRASREKLLVPHRAQAFGLQACQRSKTYYTDADEVIL